MDNFITIEIEEYKELLEARYKINVIVNFIENNAFGLTKEDMECVLGIMKKEVK